MSLRQIYCTSFPCLLALVSGLTLGPTSAVAGLVGHTVALDQLYPTIDQVALSLGTATVGTGVEFSASLADYDWDIGDSGIDFNRSFTCFQPPCSLGYTPSSFNGFRLTFTGAGLPKIAGVALVEAMGFTSFDSSRITFDASSVYIQFGGIEETFEPGTVFGAKIGLQFARLVPEPPTPLMVLGGLALVGLVSRIRRTGRGRWGLHALGYAGRGARGVVTPNEKRLSDAPPVSLDARGVACVRYTSLDRAAVADRCMGNERSA